MNVTPTQSQTLTAIRSFLLAVLPAGVEVVMAQQNRVPEPRAKRYVIMTPMRYTRLRTNVDTPSDVAFTAAIVAGVMTVSAVQFGTILVGATVFGTGVANPTTVTALGTGTGGTGTYVVSPVQDVTSRTMATGAMLIEQGAEADVQLDFHSDDNSSADMAQTVSTLFRDEYGVQQFAGQSPATGVVPLYADDPRQMPFLNDQQQVENRWIVEASVQVNQVVQVAQQFAAELEVSVISVDAVFPPT